MALLTLLGSRHMRIFPFLCATAMELTQSVGSVTFFMNPSPSISRNFCLMLGSSALGCCLGACTTGSAFGSISNFTVRGITPVVFWTSGQSSATLHPALALDLQMFCGLSSLDPVPRMLCLTIVESAESPPRRRLQLPYVFCTLLLVRWYLGDPAYLLYSSIVSCELALDAYLWSPTCEDAHMAGYLLEILCQAGSGSSCLHLPQCPHRSQC